MVILLAICWVAQAANPILLASVDLKWFGSYQDDIATYWYKECLTRVGIIKWMYSCENMILTFNWENWWWNKDATHKNGAWLWVDAWLCQLNSKYHKKFIGSEDFEDPYKQMDYCIGVRKDAQKKWTMPRYAFKVRYKRWKGVHFINPPLSDAIAEPTKTWTVKVESKRKCRQVFTAIEWQTFQLDSKFWKFISWILGLKQGDKWFICSEV